MLRCQMPDLVAARAPPRSSLSFETPCSIVSEASTNRPIPGKTTAMGGRESSPFADALAPAGYFLGARQLDFFGFAALFGQTSPSAGSSSGGGPPSTRHANNPRSCSKKIPCSRQTSQGKLPGTFRQIRDLIYESSMATLPGGNPLMTLIRALSPPTGR